MSQNLTTSTVTVKGATTPEIRDAIRTARSASWRLEADYFAFDWEARLELAEELREMLDELPDDLVDVAARVASDLESELEDFSDWDTRSDASRRILGVAHALEHQPDPLTLSNHPGALAAHINGEVAF
jgi:hypothetical protein